MRAVALFALLFLALPAGASGVWCGEKACSQNAPTFKTFESAITYAGSTAPVNFDTHPRAKRFRLALAAGAAKGPNFAGHYTVVTWGCGVACQELAIIDAKTGKVFFPSNLRLNAYHVVHEDPLPTPLQFQRSSSLIIAIGSPNDSEEHGIFFYHWNGKRLNLVYEETREWQ